MKPYFIKYFFAMAMALCLCGCEEEPEKLSPEADRFIELTKEGFMIKRSYEFIYDDESCQRIVNMKRKTILLQTDVQSAYVKIKFNEHSLFIPVVGEEVVLAILYKTAGDSSENTLSMKMTTLKSEEGKVWLWNEINNVGIIVKIM